MKTPDPELLINHCVSRLRDAGAFNVGEYETRLRKNAGRFQTVQKMEKLYDFLSEAKAALMLLEHGAQITMSDSPDLAVVLNGERFYAEVKRFRVKQQDGLNEVAERTAPDFELTLLEDTTRTEGIPPCHQIADVAKKKANQYKEGGVNVLIIDSDSETLDLMAESGAAEFSDNKEQEPPESPLHRLNGIMIINPLVLLCHKRNEQQKGHLGSNGTSEWAKALRSVVMECGWWRSGRSLLRTIT